MIRKERVMTDERELEELSNLLLQKAVPQAEVNSKREVKQPNKKDTYISVSENKTEAWLYLSRPKDGNA